MSLYINDSWVSDLIAVGEDGEDAVIDHGPGIPLSERDAVLRPFYRIEGSRSRDTGGIGLGLSIASDTINAHGGRMTLSDTPGGGLMVEGYRSAANYPYRVEPLFYAGDTPWRAG